MFKPSTLPRLVYLLLIVGVFAAILAMAAFTTSLPPADATQPAAVAVDGAQPEATTGQADSAAAADIQAVKYDHHGNPIREDPIYEKVVSDGVAVEFTAENFLGVGGRGGEIAPELFEGEFARLKFRISQADTAAAIADLRPSVWMELQRDTAAADSLSCEEKVEGYLSGALTSRPDVNLNSYFILALNNDASISVIDPMIDVAGMTNLYALMQLPQPGQDWAMSADQQQLFVTIPATNQVAVANLEQFRVVQHLDAGRNPVRVAFQPNQEILWVGNDGPDGGVTAINPVGLKVIGQLPTGAGHHELAFSGDSRYAFVTNSDAGTLSVIDTRQLAQVTAIEPGPQPASVTVSEQNDAIYVADAASGDIVVLDGEDFSEVTRLATAPGLVYLAFAPGGRWGFGLNPRAGQVTIFDAAGNSIRHTLPVAGGPDQISFSAGTAYIRSGGSPEVVAIALADLEAGQTPAAVKLAVGQNGPGAFPNPAVAGAMLTAPGEGAVMMANPADDQIYYYVEGTASAQGGFQGHGLFPRALLVVDRSISEEAPGVYAGSVRLPQSGTYSVAFLLNQPRIVHCFEMKVKPGRNSAEAQAGSTPRLEVLDAGQPFKVGQPYRLQFELTDSVTGQPLTGLTDVVVLANQTGGNWNQQLVAQSVAAGRYEVELTAPAPGLYNVVFGIPSLQINFNGFPNLNLMTENEAEVSNLEK